MVAGEKQERFARGPFIAHEHQRNHRREQQQRSRGPERIGGTELWQTLAERPVADLVVVLQEQHKGGRCKVAAGLASGVPMTRLFAQVDKTFAEQARKLVGRLFGEVRVVGIGFAGQQHVQRVVPVIVPLRVETLVQQAGLIELIFKVQPHVSGRFDPLAHAGGELGQECLVANGVDGVHAQPVDAVFEQPHKGVVDEEIPHLRAPEIDRVAPRCVQVAAEELLGVTAQVVAVRTEVVVHHVQNHHQANAMSGVDQVFELFGSAI